jgi:hypothetical protein
MGAADKQHRMSQEKHMWQDHNKYLHAECVLQIYDTECDKRSTCDEIILHTRYIIIHLMTNS